MSFLDLVLAIPNGVMMGRLGAGDKSLIIANFLCSRFHGRSWTPRDEQDGFILGSQGLQSSPELIVQGHYVNNRKHG